MNVCLTQQQKEEFVKRGFSRRTFGRIAAMMAAGAALPFYNEPALAQLSAVRGDPADAVMINANENPLGPCEDARGGASTWWPRTAAAICYERRPTISRNCWPSRKA